MSLFNKENKYINHLTTNNGESIPLITYGAIALTTFIAAYGTLLNKKKNSKEKEQPLKEESLDERVKQEESINEDEPVKQEEIDEKLVNEEKIEEESLEKEDKKIEENIKGGKKRKTKNNRKKKRKRKTIKK
tara:strand:+ start:233 stop:628 length:396 start_codon:yes stop_codon:yes gene_type:complete